MKPEVSAVITTHARPASVCDALASVVAETHASCEVIVVDDGGNFVSPVENVRVIHGSNLGVGRARNAGLAAARGEFIIYLDDDDVAMPHRIATLLHAAKQRHATLCFGMTLRAGADGDVRPSQVPTHVSSGALGFSDLLACNPHVNAVLARTDRLRAIGGFDAECEHFDDWSAWLRLADRGEVIWKIDDVVAEWRIHHEGLSAQVLSKRAMKTRLLSLFRRLRGQLSPENARAIARAEEVVMSTRVATYDDYVNVIAAERREMAGVA